MNINEIREGASYETVVIFAGTVTAADFAVLDTKKTIPYFPRKGSQALV